MPLILPKGLPAIGQLKQENIDITDSIRDNGTTSVTLRIAVLNLMPIKETTETDLLRLLSNTPCQTEVSFMKVRSHVCKHTCKEHMDRFYTYFDEMKDDYFDGFIMTGAPVELLDFEQVDYWAELVSIFRWAETHVGSTLFICWAAQAALHFHYGIEKHPLPTKKFGVFTQRIHNAQNALLRGFDDIFCMPHSRHTEIYEDDIKADNRLTVLADSPECGASIVAAKECRQIFITGHMEYSPYTLDSEYKRDCGKRDDVELPKNYYENDNPDGRPLVTWRSHANLLYINWMNRVLLPLRAAKARSMNSNIM